MRTKRHRLTASAHDIAEVAAGRGSARDRAEVRNSGGLSAARRKLRSKRHRLR